MKLSYRYSIKKRSALLYFLVDTSIPFDYSIISKLIDDIEDEFHLQIENAVYENPDCDLIIKFIKASEEPSIATYPGNQFNWGNIVTNGNFFFGKAISLLTKDVKENFDTFNFDPIFILMSGSSSADWWQPYLKRLYNLETFNWGHKIAIKIGKSTDDEMLLAFTRDKDNIYSVHNINLLKNAIRLTYSYPEWFIWEGHYAGCSEDMALIMSKAVELNGKDILYTPKIIHILNDYHAFNTNKALCFVLKIIQEDEGFIPLLNSDNWFLDSLNFINEIHKRTGIEILSIQHVLNAIGFALDHSIPLEYGMEKN